MALAYDAQDTRSNRQVRLRVIPVEGAAAVRVPPEAEQATQLRHPSIVQVLDVRLETDPQGKRALLVATEPVVGRPMTSFMGADQLEGADFLKIVSDAAKTVAYAHARGVVHRDLRPSNLIVTKGGSVLVTGFAATPPDPLSDKHDFADPATTPAYLAPEQAERKADAITPRSDVYTLGVILYEALTHHLPFTATSVVEFTRMLLKDNLEPPSTHVKGIDPDLERICMKALERDPSFRYAHAGELAEELGRFRKHIPVETRPMSPVTRRWQKLTQNRSTRMAGIAVGAAIALAVVAWLLLGGDPPPAPPPLLPPAVAPPPPPDPEDANALAREGSRLVQAALDAAGSGTPDPAALKAAEKLLEKALELHPGLPGAQFSLGRAREARGDDEGALPWFNAVIRTDPDHRAAYLRRGGVFLRAGNPNAALRDYNEAIKRDPANAEALMGRGLANQRKADLPAALADLNEAIRIDPRNPTALFHRAYVRAETQDLPGARADLEQALKLAPKDWSLAEQAKEALAQLKN
jgi:tetratricopeptide (TPR) repeat protein